MRKRSGILPLLRFYARGYAREMLDRVRLRRELRSVEKQHPILVYQMGKVGSSTVVDTLHQLRLDRPVLHLHTLAADRLAFAKARQRGSGSPFLHEHLLVSTILEKKLSQAPFPCSVITLTREPISRAISFVFEDRVKQAPHALKPDGTVDTAALSEVVNQLLASPDNGTADPSLWFDGELRSVFGVDVFAHPYDLERGYTIIPGEHVRVLVLRMEDLNRSLALALADFLGLDAGAITLREANVGGAKWYSGYLEEVKRTLQLPPDVARSVFGTRYFKHFYAQDALRITERWTAPSARTSD